MADLQSILIYDLKNAIQDRLEEYYPTDVYFRIDGDLTSYPCFYIRNIEIMREPLGMASYQRFKFTYSFMIAYYLAENWTAETSVNTKLDNVGMTVQDALRYIDVYGLRLYPTQLGNETVDGTRQINITVSLYGTYPELEAVVMQTLDQTTNFKED